jgi:hypothetical protein
MILSVKRITMFCLVLVAAAVAVQAQKSPTTLLNGKDLSGWEQVGPGRFVVEEGLLKSEGGMGLLWYTSRRFGNAVIRVVYKTAGTRANSGVFIRIPERPTEPWMPVNRGYEVQIDNAADDYHTSGVLYSFTKVLARAEKPGEWNILEIVLDRLRTIVKLNGITVTDYTEGQPVPPKRESYEPERGPRQAEGFIGLQNHGNNDVVFFREISVTPL